jgi:copper amine oxidase-like protein
MTRTTVMALLLVVALAGVPQGHALAQASIPVYIDGQAVNFDVPPTVIQGRVLVPLRGIFERLGATVDYDVRTQHIVAVRGPQTVELTIGSRQARVNDSAKLLDVPAFTIAGRTMVPLRFISESLGANVQWVEASRIILIGSSGASPPPPPSASSAPAQSGAPQTITGRLVAVTTGDNPSIVVRSSGQDRTVAVTPNTVIYRYNSQSNAGGSASLGSLQRGDRASVEMNGQNQATKITATYQVAAAGKIATVNGNNHTVTLTSGQSFVVLPDARITLNGQAADWTVLQNGRNARFLVVEGTNQAYEVNVVEAATQTPTPSTTPAAPTITAPANGTTVGSAFSVQGSAQPRALVVVRAQPRLLGASTQAQTTADGNGRWKIEMNLSSVPLVAFPYVVSAVEIVNGVQSDPSSVEINVH